MSSKVISKKPQLITIKKKSKNNIFNNSTKSSVKFLNDFSPTSGSELEYNPEIWDKSSIVENHNCYTYALGNIVPKLTSKAQPGYASGYSHLNDINECSLFYDRLKKDSPGSYSENFDNACLPGFYKIFLALDPGNDYHWWRQNKDIFWSHKPGSTSVKDVDGDGLKIKNPYLSSRNFKHRNYYKPCFFACIYSDLARSLDVIYSL